jgi:metacaspase-1
MKTRLPFITISFFLFSICAKAQTQHALLIGIGDYDTKTTGWAKLNCVRDVEIVKRTLERQNFKSENIATLTDQQATKDGIIGAMRSLIASVKQNSKDVVYIHISSHGAQIEDDNGDETDGLDEAIVTINARWTEDKDEFKKVQGDYLRDDQFGDLIEQLRAKLGKDGDVVVVMDLCHSGTATRGELVARGNKAPIVSANFQAKKEVKDNPKEFRENKAARGDNSNMATYVVFSAARADECAYETYNDDEQKMGALSYAICKTLETVQNDTTYRTVFARIESIMDQKSNIQHPMVEGNGLDRGFFGGKIVPQKPLIDIESVDEENNQVKIKTGMFSGVDAGTGISFYANGADPDKATPLAKGKVISTGQFSSVVSLDKNTGKQPKEFKAFITEPVFKVRPVLLKIYGDKVPGAQASKLYSSQEMVALKDRLKNLKQVTVSNENPDLLLVKGDAFDSLFVANNGYLFATTQKKSLEDVIKLYSKYKYLKQLEVKDPTINVDVKLGKLVNGKPEFPKPSKTITNLVFHELDTMIVSVKNNSRFDVFVNILDFEPGGKVNAIFPNKAMNNPIQASELKIPAGKEIVFKSFRIIIRPPYGPEVFKVFVSDMEIDMEGVAREFKARGLMNALEGITADIPAVASRGGDTINLAEAKGVVYNIPFQIAKRD